MGLKKTDPNRLRFSIIRTRDSRWYAEGSNYGDLLMDDIKMRKFIMKTLPQAAISKVVIERPAKTCRVSIYAARPSVIIGKKGVDIEKLRRKLAEMSTGDVSLNIVEIRKPEVDAQLVAQGIGDQLIRRVAFRRAMKRAVQSALRLGAEGIKIVCGGRLGGAEIARVEWYREGRVPLHTLRANIDYAEHEALTAYGIIGIKVWIFKGEILARNQFVEKDQLSIDHAETVEDKTSVEGTVLSVHRMHTIFSGNDSDSVDLSNDQNTDSIETNRATSLSSVEQDCLPVARLAALFNGTI